METVTEQLTTKRIAELRQMFERAREMGGAKTSYGRMATTGDDLLDEIVRLRDWLQHIHDEKNHSGYTLRHYAWRALEGQTVEEWASE